MFDPTNDYESYKEIQAEMYFEEQREKSFEEKVFSYISKFKMKNRKDIEMYIGDAFNYANGQEIWTALTNVELERIVELVEKYIKLKDVQFDKQGNIILMKWEATNDLPF